MADYYPLIAKVAMGRTTPERRTLYERGREALIAELEAVKPPLRQSTVKRELIAFEEAVRRVEAEIARGARDHRG
jgi:hypothetical protein